MSVGVLSAQAIRHELACSLFVDVTGVRFEHCTGEQACLQQS